MYPGLVVRLALKYRLCQTRPGLTVVAASDRQWGCGSRGHRGSVNVQERPFDTMDGHEDVFQLVGRADTDLSRDLIAVLT